MDTTLFTLVNASHVPWLDDVMLLASSIGRAGFVWWVTGLIAMVIPRYRMAAWRLFIAVAMAYVLVDGVIKPVIGRDRPFEVVAGARLIDQRPVTSSFPSGHTAAAFAGALAAGRLFPRARIAWWLLAGGIALSRVYVGAHWPTDVLSGAALGLAVGWWVLGGRPVRPRGYPESDVAGPDQRRSSA
ncbi:MAG: phosphatase PAP2 family protein [Vicinamibacterales bacterium]